MPEALEPRRLLTNMSLVREAIVDEAHTRALTVGDLDNDGDLDIVVSGAWYERLGDDAASPTFKKHPLPATRGSTSIHVADLDLDGRQDIVFGHDADPTKVQVSWLRQGNDGRFAAPTRIGDSLYWISSAIVVADLNGDGYLDVAAAAVGGLGGGDITWFRNRGDTTFETVSPRLYIGESVVAMAAGDLDADGDLDLAAGISSDFPFGVVMWFEKLNDQDGFREHVLRADENNVSELELFDADHDNDLDIVVGSREGIQWFENSGEGTFHHVHDIASQRTCDLEAADLDGDGDPDIVAQTGEHCDTLLTYTNTDATFAPSTGSPSHCYRLKAANLDGDPAQ